MRMKKPLLSSLLFVFLFVLPLTAFSQETLWGYSTAPDFSVAGSGGGRTEIAMWVPGDGELKGAKITAVNLPFATDDATNISIWSVPSIEYAAAWLPAKTFEQKYSGKVKGNGYTRVDFKSPLAIPAEGFFIGYSFDTNYYYPICTADGEAKDGLWLYENKFGRWYDYPELGVSALQLFVTGMQLDESKVSILQVQSRKCQKGGEALAELTLASSSAEPVQSIGYAVELDGKTQNGTATLAEPIPSGLNQYGNVTISFTAPKKAGTYQGLVSITAVNGKPYNDHSAAGFDLDVRDELHQRLTLIEEFTGTWCGNCPRGWLALERVHEKQADQALVVAVHQYNNNDPMYCPDYADLPWDGAPSCCVDRTAINIDPYYGEWGEGMAQCVNKYSDVDPTAVITVAGSWADANHSSVNATADVKFLAGSPGSRVAFVLTADGITGTGSPWRQNNDLYQTDPNGMGDLAIFCKGGAYGDGYIFLTYNDVMCGSTWTKQTNGSIKDGSVTLSPTTKGSTAFAASTVSLNASSLMRQAMDYGKVYLTAIVFNADGTVANAARCRVGATEGINVLRQQTTDNGLGTTDNGQQTTDLSGRAVGLKLHGNIYIQQGKKVIAK